MFEELTEERLEELVGDFGKFLEYCFYYLRLPSPTDTQFRLAEHLGANPDRLIINAFRGVGKTWITGTYTAWRLLRNVDEKILIVSATGPKAAEISQFVRKLFSIVPLLNHLEPTKDQRDSIIGFDIQGCKVAVSPSVKAIGINGQMTGSRGSLIIFDDIEIPNNSMTELMRTRLLDRAKEAEALLIPDMDSSIIVLGTPQTQESIYRKMDKEMGYRTIIIPAEVPENPEVYEGRLDDWVMLRGKPGDPVDPQRFTSEELSKRKAGYGLSGFKLQFMLDTTLSDAEKYPLKLKDLIVYSTNKEEAPFSISYTSQKEYIINDIPNIGFTGDRLHRPFSVSDRYNKYDVKIMAIDPAGGTDDTAYSIVGVYNGNVYLLDVGGYQGYGDDTLVKLANKAKEYRVNTIVLEKNWGDGMFTVLFTKIVSKIYPCSIDEVTSKGQKEVRIINSIEPLTTNHKLIIDYELLQKDAEEAINKPDRVAYSFIHQFTHITRDRNSLVHDDKLDALAIACEYIKHMVVVDSEALLRAIEEQEMERFLEEKIYGKYTTNNKIYTGNMNFRSIGNY